MALDTERRPNDLDAFWMPFTANRQFKAAPRMLVAAEGMHYTASGRAQHSRRHGRPLVRQRRAQAPRIVKAIQEQAGELDYAPAFQMGHPKAFRWPTPAARHGARPVRACLLHQFGSESVDTALKIALAYHRARGDGARTRLIGRERGYHGVNFGGISVGGIVNNRRMFGNLLTGVDHLPHTHLPKTPSPAANPPMVPIWPTISSGSSPCTDPTPSPR
jgi:beta-alanine--pyruvate transaminase